MIALLLFFQSLSGEAIYNKSCALAYCHGPNGTAGRAPALTGRNYSEPVLRKVIVEGIPSRGMPPFKRFSNAELRALMSYITLLEARPANAPAAKPAAAKLPPDLARGRDLFYDSARLPGCASCHPNGLRRIADVQDLMTVRTPNVRAVRIEREPPFPAIVIDESGPVIRILDLSAALPVNRSIPRAQLEIGNTANWPHAALVNRYTPPELESILKYLLTRSN